MSGAEVPGCAVCERSGDVAVEPRKRTLARGTDPEDPSFGIIAVLPDIRLCAEHAEALTAGELTIGWCDNEGCRLYGPDGGPSPCGALFTPLRR